MARRVRRVVVLGGGAAGLATALLLARDGHAVVVIERDDLNVGDAVDAWVWPRKGVAHFRQPHAFIPRGRRDLIAELPDVHRALLQAGAHDVDLRPKLPGGATTGDEDLQYLAVRRSLIEWALRKAVSAEPRIAVRAGMRVTGVVVEVGRVTGVQVADGTVEGDLVIDAMGRRSPVPSWLREAGLRPEASESSECGVVYFSRYYRTRPGFTLPDGPWLLSPRGDLGYLAYASFPGDNGTFAALLAAPPGVAQWRAFQDAAVFDAAIARIPALASWVDPDGTDPITPVMPMAGLRNSLQRYDPKLSPGLVPIGDALCHTDPVLAHGLAFALIHAAALRCALSDHSDTVDVQAQFADATAPLVRERFRLATELDAQRLRVWLGEHVDFTHAAGDYALFSIAAAGAVAMVDADVFRVFVRRTGLLDSTSVLDDDIAMQHRIETSFAKLARTPRPPAGPSREEMAALTNTTDRDPTTSNAAP